MMRPPDYTESSGKVSVWVVEGGEVVLLPNGQWCFANATDESFIEQAEAYQLIKGELKC